MPENIYFSPALTDRERACFESGIKLGALYHILCGIPISTKEQVISAIERGIEASISCQPYVKEIKINLNRDKIVGTKKTQFDYDEISGGIIQAELVLEFKSVIVLAKVEWINNLEYPLMYIKEIKSTNPT